MLPHYILQKQHPGENVVCNRNKSCRRLQPFLFNSLVCKYNTKYCFVGSITHKMCLKSKKIGETTICLKNKSMNIARKIKI